MLNSEQKKAVHTTEGRVLILAGAGSGKTSVIVHRIGHLVNTLKVSPKAILGLTFTNKAADEMRHRVAAIIDKELAPQVTLCTFHSFCMQVLRKEIQKLGYTRDFSLYDERDVRRLAGQLARSLLQHEGELPSLESTLGAISRAKSQALTSKEIQGSELCKDLFERLQVCMRAYNAVDFDSLLSLTLQLFEEHPQTLSHYQERFRYIMIDEYQDTNPVQYRLAKLLSSGSGNLCVVGDDDQAIYGWRGADIKNILRFESETVIKLEQNYRSTPIILQAANAVIRNNTERHKKELWSSQGQGEPVTIFHAPTEEDEAASVVQRMIWLRREKKIPWRDMAILYRSNILARPFEMALMQAAWQKEEEWIRGIPYQTFGGTEFYERAEVKDLAAYVRGALNPLDEEALLRIVNTPRRGISDQTLDLLTAENRSKNIPLWNVLKNPPPVLSEKAAKSIASFVSLMEDFADKLKTPPYATSLQWLVETIDYEKAIEEDVKSDKMRQFKWDNVQTFIQSADNFADVHEFLGSITLNDDSWARKEKTDREDKVNLMTFHSAKGLEFTVCFLVGLEDHIIPHEKSLSEGGLEEERRLMYVAMTRAKKYLTMSMARKRKRYGKESNSNPSRFLFEIPKELMRASPWGDVN